MIQEILASFKELTEAVKRGEEVDVVVQFRRGTREADVAEAIIDWTLAHNGTVVEDQEECVKLYIPARSDA